MNDKINTIHHWLEVAFISRCRKGYYQDWHTYGRYSVNQHLFNRDRGFDDLP